jgi:hypothetical protein
MAAGVELLVIMLMTSRRSNSKSMSSRCGETPVMPPNTRREDMVWAAVVRLHGRVCTTMFRNPSSLHNPAAVDVVASRRVEATEARRLPRLIHPKPLQLMLQLDRRMLGSQVRTIVAVAEVDLAATIHMLDDRAMEPQLQASIQLKVDQVYNVPGVYSRS